MKVTRRGLLAGSSALAVATVAGIPLSAAGRGAVMVISTSADMVHFDPHIGGDLQTTYLIRNVYDSLLSVTGTPPALSPRLAKEYTVSEDGLVYTFHLVDTATFHDGTPVTSADVKYSFDRLRRIGKGNAWMIRGVVGDDSVATPDAQTVVITLDKPFAAFPQVLPWLTVVNSKLIEANLGEDDGQTYLLTHTAGSGPFTLTRFDPSSVFLFGRVADNWHWQGAGGGNLAGTAWKIIRESASKRLTLERNETQFCIGLEITDIDALEDRAGIETVIQPDYSTYMMRMNTAHGPLADINLRKAISYAFNYEGMQQIGARHKMLVGPFPSSMPFFDTDLVPYRQDLGKAKEYLAKSAYPQGGITLKMSYSIGLDIQRQCCQLMLESLRPLGITVDIVPTRWADLTQQVKSPETAPDIMSINQASNYADPDNIAYAAYHSSSNGQWQNPVFHDAALDKLIEAGRAETDTTRRAQIYKDIQQRIVEQAPDVFGYNFSQLMAMRSSVTGFAFCPVGAQSIDCFPISMT